jgi:hypothetical protein
MKRSAPFDTAFGPSKITPRPEWAECLLRGSFGTAFGPILGTLIGSRFRPHSTPHSTHGGEGAGIFKRLPPDPRTREVVKIYVQNLGCEHRDFVASGYTSPHPSSPHPSSEQGFLKLIATETY